MAAEPAPGASFGDYEILAELGAGGMGRVFKARHVTLQREVALKVLGRAFASDEAYRQRFLKEARAAARLNHPNIVQIYDFGRVDETFYIAMEFVRGESVGDRIRRQGRFTEADAVATVAQACTALRVAHAAGIVHRDVKPDNLLLSADGVVKLVDLGLAKSTTDDANLTQTGVVSGTPHYISPEQIAGSKDVDGRADVYSLGATLYHMVTGHTPFEGSSPMVVVAKHLHDDPADPRSFAPALSDGLCAVIRRMMARDRDARYPDMAAVGVDLQRLGRAQLPGASASDAAATVVQSAGARSAAARAAAPAWDSAVLARLEESLAAAIGPMAKVLVRREAARTSDLGALAAALAPSIPSEATRKAFLADLTRDAAPAAPTTRARSGAASEPTPASRASGAAGSGPVAWNEDALRTVELRLADAVGPLARVLVKKAARSARSWDELVTSLAAAVPAERQAAFRAEAARVAH